MFYNNAQVFLDLCYEELMDCENESINESLNKIQRLLPQDKQEDFIRSVLKESLPGIFSINMNENEFEYIFDVFLKDVVKGLKTQAKSMVVHVKLEGQEDNLYRTMEIPYGITLLDMAYMILGSFKVNATHLFNISFKNKIYKCLLDPSLYSFDEDDYEDDFYASDYMISDLGVKKGSTFELCYDLGDNYIFDIEVIQVKNQKTVFSLFDSQILDGNGYGIWEDAHYWLDLYYDDKDYFYEMMDKEGLEEDYFSVNEEFDLVCANESLLQDFLSVSSMYEEEMEEEDEWDV